jgi:CBS domain-containing protein
MRRDYSTISGREMLQAALDKLDKSSCRLVPVMEGGTLLGLFTIENLASFCLFDLPLETRKASHAVLIRTTQHDDLATFIPTWRLIAE